MGLASLIAGMAGAAASAVNSAMSSNKKPSSSTSSGSTSGGSSSGSSGSSNSSQSSGSTSGGTSGGTYKPLGTYNDADLQKYYPQEWNQIQQYKNQYEESKAMGDKDGMNTAWKGAEAIRNQHGYSGGSDGSQFIPTGMGYTIADMANQKAESNQIIAELQNAASQYQQQQQQQLDNINAQYQAALGQMQSNIDAQKQDAAKQTALNNAAAEQAYMQTIKPNGSLAENLAANGLLSSGVTESSQIQAGNTYQNALNNNATTQTELIAELERMAAQAEYTNDLERLQAIQQVMAQIAETGYASAKDIASLRQWSVENSQNYNTQQKQLEMQRQQIQEDLANGKIDRQTAEKQLEYLNAQIEEIQLTNKYNKYQLGQLGIS